jgi:hypothetical protein
MEAMFPYRFEATRKSGDSIRLVGFNEDGSREGQEIELTHAVACELLAVLSVEIAADPYARWITRP